MTSVPPPLFGSSSLNTPTWGSSTTPSNSNKRTSSSSAQGSSQQQRLGVGESSTPSNTSTAFGASQPKPVETPPTTLNGASRTSQFSFGNMSVSTPTPNNATTATTTTATSVAGSAGGGRALFGMNSTPTGTNEAQRSSNFSFSNSAISSRNSGTLNSRAPPQSNMPSLIVEDYNNNNHGTLSSSNNNIATSSFLNDKGFGLRQRRGSNMNVDTSIITPASTDTTTMNNNTTRPSKTPFSNSSRPPKGPPPKLSRLTTGLQSIDPSLMTMSFSSPMNSTPTAATTTTTTATPSNSNSRGDHAPFGSAKQKTLFGGIFGGPQKDAEMTDSMVLRDSTNTTTAPTTNNSSLFSKPSSKATPTTSVLSTSRSKPNTLTTASIPDYSKWVVVYGFCNSKQYQTIMSRFESLGSIQTSFPSKYHERKITIQNTEGKKIEPAMNNNWVCIEYESNLLADKAMCQHGSLLDVGARGANRQKVISKTKSEADAIKDVVVVGVMRVDLQVANTLGLRQFLEFGSCAGVDRTSLLNNGEEEEDKDDGTTASASTQKKQTNGSKNTNIMNEEDVLLTLTDYEEMVSDKSQPSYLSTRVGHGGLIEMILGWMFKW